MAWQSACPSTCFSAPAVPTAGVRPLKMEGDSVLMNSHGSQPLSWSTFCPFILMKCTRVAVPLHRKTQVLHLQPALISPGSSTWAGTQPLLLATGAHETLLTRHFNTHQPTPAAGVPLFRRHVGAMQKPFTNTTRGISAPSLWSSNQEKEP